MSFVIILDDGDYDHRDDDGYDDVDGEVDVVVIGDDNDVNYKKDEFWIAAWISIMTYFIFLFSVRSPSTRPLSKAR